MSNTLMIIGLLAIAPFAIGCSDDGGTTGAAGMGGTGGVTVLPNGGVCSGTNTPCEIGCEETDCAQQCDGNLNTAGTIQVVCSATCSGGGCAQDCDDGATCTFTCDGGGCQQLCDDAGGSTCNFTCTGGGCT